jgi:hypothetical protein
LLVEREDWPIGISDKDEGRLEIEIESGLDASRLIGDIGPDGGREGVAVEVDELRVIDGEAGVGVAGEDAVIIGLTDTQLSGGGAELPVAVVIDGVEHVHEAHRHLRAGVDEGLVPRKVIYRQLLRDLVHVVRQLVRSDESHHAPVVDGEDGRQVEP